MYELATANAKNVAYVQKPANMAFQVEEGTEHLIVGLIIHLATVVALHAKKFASTERLIGKGGKPFLFFLFFLFEPDPKYVLSLASQPKGQWRELSTPKALARSQIAHEQRGARELSFF